MKGCYIKCNRKPNKKSGDNNVTVIQVVFSLKMSIVPDTYLVSK